MPELFSPDEVILGYQNHVDEKPYIELALNTYDAATLVGRTVSIVSERNYQRLRPALLFIRDVSSSGFGDEIRDQFRPIILNSSLFDEMKSCLSVPNFGIRSHTVYTFGKLSFKENISVLVETFEKRRDIDPLLMDSLLFEIRWLEQSDNNHWKRIEFLADSPANFSRWCAVQSASREVSFTEDHEKFNPILVKLANDAFHPVRLEALYWLEEARKHAYNRNLSREERKQRKSGIKKENARIDTLKPPLTFFDLEILFWKFHVDSDYTVLDLQTFLENFEAENRSTG